MELPRVFVTLMVVLLLLQVPAFVGAQDFTFALPDVTHDYSAATGTGSFTVAMTLDENVLVGSDPLPVQGWSVSVVHDATLLTANTPVISSELDPAVLGFAFGFEYYSEFPTGWTSGVVIDLFSVVTLQFPDPVALLTVTYDLVPGSLIGATSPTTTELLFGPDTGAVPSIDNVVVVDSASFTVTEQNSVVTLVPHDGPPFIRGDTDMDGILSIGDAIGVFSYLFVNLPMNCLDAVDANDNGLISVSDGVTILCELFCVGTPPLPGPFPNCGFDGTADGLDCQVNTACP